MTAPKILIVDDEPGISALMAAMLKRRGYETLVAAGGEQALELFRHARPNLILLDLHMPVMDGYEVIDRIRDLDARQGQQTPIVLLTAHCHEYILNRETRETRADACLSKPVTAPHLIETIEGLLGG